MFQCVSGFAVIIAQVPALEHGDWLSARKHYGMICLVNPVNWIGFVEQNGESYERSRSQKHIPGDGL